MPVVSVVLPVYNCPVYIGEAVQSILDQTFEDFEFIIIDDGSLDNTSDIVKTFTDTRIRFFQQKNQGLAATLNRGIELSRGKYIARMDHDDISLPERLEKQVKYLNDNPDCGMVGTWADIYLEKQKTERVHHHPADNITLQYELLLNNPFVHSSMMLRKSVLERVGLYSTDCERQPPEDYELWSRIARRYEIANIPETLQVYREVSRSMSRDGASPFLHHLVMITAENIAWAANISATSPDAVNIAALFHGDLHRIQEKPNFHSMRRVLLNAVARVTYSDVRFQSQAENTIQQLKLVYQYSRAPSVGERFYALLRKAKNKILSRLTNQER